MKQRYIFSLLMLLAVGLVFAPSASAEPATVISNSWHNGVPVTASRTIDPALPYSEGWPDPQRAPVNPWLDATGSLLWQAADPTGMMNNVAVSGDGSIAATAIDLNNSRLQVFNGVTGALIYEVPAADPGSWGSVAITHAGDRVVYSTGTVVHYLTAGNSTPIWTADPGPGRAVTRVAVSRDGSMILAMESQTTQNQDSVRVWAFTPASSTPVWTRAFSIAQINGIMGAAYSADGTKLVITGRMRLFVVNPVNGDVIWETPAYNTEHAAGVSGDGRVISYGSNNDGKIRVFHWDPGSQTYILLWSYTFTGGSSNWGTATAVSANGETVAGGSLQFFGGGNAGYVAVFETYGGGVPLWPPVDLGDLVGGMAISDDGLTVAACSWGPLGAGPADIQVWDKYNATPFYTYQHPGSPNDIALTPDGSRLFAGGKAVHNRTFGNGGNSYFYSLDLEGGSVSGTVTLQGTADHSGVTVRTHNGVRHVLTNASGAYQISHIPAGTYTIIASKPGYGIGQANNIVVTDGGSVTNLNFALDTAGVAPANLNASQNIEEYIQLSWNPVTLNGRWEREREIRVAVGDLPYDDPRGPVAAVAPERPPFSSPRDPIGNLDEADSIRVWRSAISGGPYTPIATLPGTATTYSDDIFGLLPGVSYYYVVTAVYPSAESAYSNQAVGILNADYLDWSPVAPPMVTPVTFDGILSPNEWADAVRIDISDVMGYDGQDLPGTAFLYMKYDDANDMLLVAAEDHANTSLDDSEGIGFYVDDDDSDTWTYGRPGSEGNYWAYWHPGGADLRYRSLSGGPYASTPYVFPNPQLGFSVAAGYLTMEVAIPMGFHNVYEIALYGPDRTPGVGAFIIERQAGNPVFHGYWPQNMPSIVSNPEFFSQTTINAQLYVPPMSPSNVQVERDGMNIQVTWADPTLGIDGLPVNNLDGVNIYRNGVFADVVPAGTLSWTDAAAVYGGWYEYALSGFIPEGGGSFEGPRSVPVGVYAGADPDIQWYSFDDDEFDFYNIVSGIYEGNKEAVKFDMPDGLEKVYTVQLRTNSTASIGVSIAENENSRPGSVLVGPYWINAPAPDEFFIFHVPGLDAPQIQQDSFWVVLDWPASSPADPGIATDGDQPWHGQSWYFTNSSGWANLAAWNIMLRAGVGSTITSVDPGAVPPVVHQFRLMSNYPNPFNPETTIPFELAAGGDATLRIFNLLGQEVITLVSGPQLAGYHVAQWNGLDRHGVAATSGIYLVRLESQGMAATRKITLLR